MELTKLRNDCSFRLQKMNRWMDGKRKSPPVEVVESVEIDAPGFPEVAVAPLGYDDFDQLRRKRGEE